VTDALLSLEKRAIPEVSLPADRPVPSADRSSASPCLSFTVAVECQDASDDAEQEEISLDEFVRKSNFGGGFRPNGIVNRSICLVAIMCGEGR